MHKFKANIAVDDMIFPQGLEKEVEAFPSKSLKVHSLISNTVSILILSEEANNNNDMNN